MNRNLFRNLRFAVRTLRKNPAVTISAVLAIGVGIGATTAMFSATDGILLHPLPFPRSERLVNVWETSVERNLPRMSAAPGNYYDWRAQAGSFSAIGAWQTNIFNLASSNEPERFVGAIVDPGFFDVLGVKPMLGRVITEAETHVGNENVVLLSYATWKQRFGADAGIIGRAIETNLRNRVVIGVMPQGFEYPGQSAMWSPLALPDEARQRRDYHQLRVIARLKDGTTLEQAGREMSAVHARLAQQYPEFDEKESAIVNSMLADLVGPVRPALLILMGAVAAVLLIACANVANLLLAKASGRQREMAIRSSLGAGRAAIIGQMLAESSLLGAMGGALGLLLAYVALQGLVALAPANTPRLDQVGLNWQVAAMALALSAGTGVLFGLAPAWFAARVDVNSLLKDGGRGNAPRSRLRSALVVAQLACALILLAGAGLLMRSFQEVLRTDAGFDPDHVMTMRVAPARVRFANQPDKQIQLARGILQKIQALPGVRTAAIATDLPLTGNAKYIMRFEGFPPVTPSQSPIADYFAVGGAFFETMGMRVIRGRALNERDGPNAPMAVVVNQTLVDRYFPGKDPIGKRLEIAFRDPPRWREIVGVVADVKSAGLDQAAPVQVFGAYGQEPAVIESAPPTLTVLARAAGEPGPLAEPMRRAILDVDRSQPVHGVQPMTEIVGQSIAQRRLALTLLAFFAASALTLAAIGVYGVMSFLVSQRTSEIGIRMALGADSAQVAWLVQRQGMLLALVGLAIGSAGAMLLTRYLGSMLYRVGERDPLVFLGAALCLVIVSAVACWLPARRAARVDPIVALRTE